MKNNWQVNFTRSAQDPSIHDGLLRFRFYIYRNRNIICSSVADPVYFNSVPDPTFRFEVSPDPIVLSSNAQLYISVTSLVLVLALYFYTVSGSIFKEFQEGVAVP